MNEERSDRVSAGRVPVDEQVRVALGNILRSSEPMGLGTMLPCTRQEISFAVMKVKIRRLRLTGREIEGDGERAPAFPTKRLLHPDPTQTFELSFVCSIFTNHNFAELVSEV